MSDDGYYSASLLCIGLIVLHEEKVSNGGGSRWMGMYNKQ